MKDKKETGERVIFDLEFGNYDLGRGEKRDRESELVRNKWEIAG